MMDKTFPAKIEALSDVLGFVDQTLEGYECPMKIQTAICVAIEEVFVNVAHYAYGDGEGDMSLGIGFDFGCIDLFHNIFSFCLSFSVNIQHFSGYFHFSLEGISYFTVKVTAIHFSQGNINPSISIMGP